MIPGQSTFARKNVVDGGRMVVGAEDDVASEANPRAVMRSIVVVSSMSRDMRAEGDSVSLPAIPPGQ